MNLDTGLLGFSDIHFVSHCSESVIVLRGLSSVGFLLRGVSSPSEGKRGVASWGVVDFDRCSV